jgi:hypothetical protein
MFFDSPLVRYNSALARYERPGVWTSKGYRKARPLTGVHKFIKGELLPPELTGEKIYKRLEGDQRVARVHKTGKAIDGKEFATQLHEQAALLARQGRWDEKETKSRCMRALIRETANRGYMALDGDVPVADKKRPLGTGADLIFRSDWNAAGYCVTELKVHKTFALSELHLEDEFGNLRAPFDVLPFSLQFLAEIQAVLTMIFFGQSHLEHDLDSDEAWVAIVSRDEEKCYFFRASPLAAQAAAIVIRLYDMKKSISRNFASSDVKMAMKRARKNETSFAEEFKAPSMEDYIAECRKTLVYTIIGSYIRADALAIVKAFLLEKPSKKKVKLKQV